MDTRDDLKIKQAIREGRSETDEGPYYHDTWWEAYKGNVKGKLGGVIIGATIGAAIGCGVLAALALAHIAPVGIAAALLVAGFSAAGLKFGAEEFGSVGTVTGAVAAAHEKSEERIKAFENGKFNELKNEIQDLKRTVSGDTSQPPATATTPTESQDYPTTHHEYPTTHCDEHCPPATNRQPIFWKVAAMGLLIGVAAGAIIASGGGAAVLLDIIPASVGLSATGAITAIVAGMGLLGASFGVNRDVFREIFDTTDLWFKGITRRHEKTVEIEKVVEPAQPAPITYVSPIDYPKTDTFHRDRVMTAAERALISFDHTRATPQ